MNMNENTIKLNNLLLDIPKISTEQHTLLGTILKTIKEEKKSENFYLIASSVFPNLSANKIKELLKENVKFTLTDVERNEWFSVNIINEIRVSDDKVFFRPAHILYDIINASTTPPVYFYLKYVLFNGIRYKQTLLFLNYFSKSGKVDFSIELNNLKGVLEFEKHQYSNFSTFRTSVIDRIVKDINEKTRYKITYKTAKKKNATKIISILFNISKKNNNE